MNMFHMQAADLPKGSLDRALLVAGFALSHYQSTLRGSKLAIPAMGETFDVVLPEKGVRVLSESVLQDYKDFRSTLACDPPQPPWATHVQSLLQPWKGGSAYLCLSSNRTIKTLCKHVRGHSTLAIQSPTRGSSCWRYEFPFVGTLSKIGEELETRETYRNGQVWEREGPSGSGAMGIPRNLLRALKSRG